MASPALQNRRAGSEGSWPAPSLWDEREGERADATEIGSMPNRRSLSSMRRNGVLPAVSNNAQGKEESRMGSLSKSVAELISTSPRISIFLSGHPPGEAPFPRHREEIEEEKAPPPFEIPAAHGEEPSLVPDFILDLSRHSPGAAVLE